MSDPSGLRWPGIVRLGLVQAAIGSVVVLMTSLLNRVMVVELGLPAALPGALIALHFGVQFYFRPRMGHRSDGTRRRTPTIILGMGLLAASGTAAAMSVSVMQSNRAAGILAASLAFAVLGIGVSAAGTPLLALLAEQVEPSRQGRAAAVVWLMMIAGFVITTVATGKLVDPFSMARLVNVVASVGAVAFAVALAALSGLEQRSIVSPERNDAVGFREAMRQAWGDPATRSFAGFIFVAMLSYSAQDLILEPFAGTVFGLTPGQSTRISGLHQTGMLLGMLAAGGLAVRFGGLSRWAIGGCAASAVSFVALSLSPAVGQLALLRGSILVLGISNGSFAIGAIGSMMARARGERAGLTMGIFGAAQAVAYAIGGFAGAAGSDVARSVLHSDAAGYGVVFLVEAALFLAAAVLAWRSGRESNPSAPLTSPSDGEAMLAALG